MLGKDWQEEKGVTEDEIVEWHTDCAHEFEQSPPPCCSSWGTVDNRLNNNKDSVLFTDLMLSYEYKLSWQRIAWHVEDLGSSLGLRKYPEKESVGLGLHGLYSP